MIFKCVFWGAWSNLCAQKVINHIYNLRLTKKKNIPNLIVLSTFYIAKFEDYIFHLYSVVMSLCY